MGCYIAPGIHVSGNFNPLTEAKPENWIDTGYKIIVPFEFKWRHKVGKVECDCTECEEHFQPWYGYSWYHSKECALIKHLKKHPQICNLYQFAGRDFDLIAQTD